MEVQGLTDETYCALSLPFLKQQSLTKIASTLLSNHHRELMDVMFQRHGFVRTEQGYNDWNERWMNFKGILSHEINQLPLPNSLNEDIREQVMNLLCSFLGLKYPQVLNQAIQFTPRGNLDISRIFEDYVSSQSFHGLPRKEKYDLLREACALFHDKCIQFILCDLLLWRRSRLEPFLRNAVRLVEVNSHGPGSLVCDISFRLEDTGDPAPWASFVVTLNNKLRSRLYSIEQIVFSFQQNVMIVSITAGLSTYLKYLWPKLTQFEKATHAEKFYECMWDADLLIDVMRFLDSSTRTRLLNKHFVAFILCFLKHPHDRYFVPDLQLQELPIPDGMFIILPVMLNHIYGTIVEGTFCRSHRDSFVELWRYFSSRNMLFGDDVLREIKKALNYVVNTNPWVRSDSHDNKTMLEFYELFLKKLQ